ncbi:MAG: NHL repeat-containing protein [Candidatus Latescibacterota bacterium]|nr:MAG: NHL repeat-containing protein [Candidatus Latescibacterota bacterium]
MDPKRAGRPRVRDALVLLVAPAVLFLTVWLPAAAADVRLVEVESRALELPDFVDPVAIASGPLGELYLGDLGRGVVVRLDSEARIDFEFETPSTQPDLQPLDLVATGFQVYVLDAESNALLRYSNRGSYLDLLQSFARRDIETPHSVAVDGTGRILLANPAQHVVRLIDETQQTETVVGGFGKRAGELTTPRSVAFAPDGAFYVADTGNARIQLFSGVGNFESALWSELGEPRGLDANARGDLFVADASGSVHVFTAERLQHMQLPLPETRPIDVAVYRDTLWVLSNAPHRLVRIRVVREE